MRSLGTALFAAVVIGTAAAMPRAVARNGSLFVSTPWPPATPTIHTVSFDGHSPIWTADANGGNRRETGFGSGVPRGLAWAAQPVG